MIDIKNDPELSCEEETKVSYYYCVVLNIPKHFHSSDLRNYFSKFVDDELFDCFHFRHRPQITASLKDVNLPENDPQNNKQGSLPSSKINKDDQLCSIVRFTTDFQRQNFLAKYNEKYWMDKKGNDVKTKCIIQTVKISPEEIKTFSKELCPPRLMPRGNVGTCTKYFLNLIKTCQLPPSLIKKLDLEFPLGRRYKKYSKVPFDYKTRNYKPLIEEDEEILTRKGHTIPSVCLSDYSPAEKMESSDQNNFNCSISRNEEGVEDANDDDDENCEDWERHESLHEDVTSQQRLKERLYEEEIEVVWEKGGPGIVWYTDASYWQELEGGFDEQTADDWDVDMEAYYTPGGGDKDARDCLEMRMSKRFSEGLDDVSVFKKPSPSSNHPKPKTQSLFHSESPSTSKNVQNWRTKYPNKSPSPIGSFECHTKGIGRKLMEKQGWREGDGLGHCKKGIKEAVESEGQGPMDRRGLGYYGQKLEFKTNKSQRPKHSHGSNPFGLDEDDRVVIGTIYDKPMDLDKPESSLRSNSHAHIKRYSSTTNTLHRQFVKQSK